MKNISIIGSTGSIGTQALDIAAHDESIHISAISAGSNVKLLAQQIRRFKPKLACIANEKLYNELKTLTADLDVKILTGEDGVSEIACCDEADTVLTSIVGIAGLKPTVDAIKTGKNIALANKETLVTAGEIIMPLAKKYGVDILPVDSEHCAIFQCLDGEDKKTLKKILLTASGGPFFGMKKEDLKDMKAKDALKHPSWNMGNKITIDSATLMNKGLEVIEAKWLFDVSAKDIQVVVHRQSVIHSMVEFVDGSVIAQLGAPDMRLPISYALNYPKRKECIAEKLDIFKVGTLTFDFPDTGTFKCLKLAFDAIEAGGDMPAVLNGANEAAVSLFLQDKIGFLDIADLVEGAMKNHRLNKNITLDDIFESDMSARKYVFDNIAR